MAGIHFFVERAKLRAFDASNPAVGQGPERAYGPVLGAQTARYRVTSSFRLDQDAMAYAACEGTVFVQPQWNQTLSQESPSLVNVVLKPKVSPNNGFTPVAFFIYRGLRRDDFVDGSELPDEADATTDFIKRVWADFNLARSAGLVDATTPKPLTERIGFHFNQHPHTDLLMSAFTVDEDDPSFGAAPQLTTVPQGATLGNFSKAAANIGFEVILADRFINPDLGMVRVPEFVVEPTTPPGPDPVPGNEAINRMRERETILNFVDPAAYFMTFADRNGGIDFRDTIQDPAIQTASSFEYAFSLISAFHTKHTLYIDLRNEAGYSLNYYKDNEGSPGGADYGSHLRVAFNYIPSTSDPTNEENYYQFFWPLFSIVLDPRTDADCNDVLVGFRALAESDLGEVVLYLDFGSTRSTFPEAPKYGGGRFLDERLSLLRPGWGGVFQLKTPNVSSASDKTAPAWILKGYLIRRLQPQIVPQFAIPRTHHLDNVFGPVIREPPLATTRRVKWVDGFGKRYIDATKEFGMELMVENAVVFSDTTVVFLLNPIDYRIRTSIDLPSSFFRPLESGCHTSRANDALQVVEDRYNPEQFRWIESSDVPSWLLPLLSTGRYYKKADRPILFMLALTRQEYDTGILPAAADLDPHLHDVYISYISLNREFDLYGFYWDTTLLVSGLDGSGLFQLLAPTGGNIRLLTHDRMLFVSEVAAIILAGGTANRPPASNPDAIFSVDDFIALVEAVEEEYRSEDAIDANGSSVLRTATRIRSHSYGIKASSGLPFTEIFAQSLPLVYQRERGRRFLLRERLPNRVFDRLTAHADENAFRDNESPYITMPQPNQPPSSIVIQQIDLGQILYGFEAILHPDLSPAYANFQPTLAREYGLIETFDLAGVIANISIPLAEVLEHELEDESVYDSNRAPSSPNLNQYYEISAPDADLRANADALGLTKAYLNLAHNRNLRMSDVLALYYRGTASLRQGLTLGNEPHFTVNERWIIFALEWRLIAPVGSKYVWLPDTNGEPWNTERTSIRNRMYAMAEFWWNRLGRLTFDGGTLTLGIFTFHGPPLTFPMFSLGFNLLLDEPTGESFLRRFDELRASTDPRENALFVAFENNLDRVIDEIFVPFVRSELDQENPGIWA